MEKTFGDYLVKYRKETPEDSKPQTMGADLEPLSILQMPTCYTRIPIEESLLTS